MTTATRLSNKPVTMLTSADERAKARTRIIDGRYPEFAMEIRKLLGWFDEDHRPYLTTRMAQRKTGINHATIATMVRGDRPAYQTIVKFAQGVGGNVPHLLKLSGYDAVETDPLARVGPNVDVSALLALPLSATPASAGLPAIIADPRTLTEAEDCVKDALPAFDRTIQVKGNCMEPFYKDGDILFVREAPSADDGETVIALVDDDVVACKVYRNSDPAHLAYLEPKNGEGRIHAARFRILGVVEGYIRTRKH